MWDDDLSRVVASIRRVDRRRVDRTRIVIF